LLDNGYISQSWWRETILLMPGHLGAVENRLGALELIRQLSSGARRDASALDAAELAAGAYFELGFKSETTRAALARGLETRLTDPELKATSNQARAAAGRALGRLGDPREDISCPIPATVLIPAGPFRMGSDVKDKKSPYYDEMVYSNEEPNHEVDLPFDYRIGKYPVTVAQYRRFVEAGGYDPKENEKYWQGGSLKWLKESGQQAPRYWDDPRWTVDNHPVVGVTWYEAVAYCAWLTATNPGRYFRLPDEAMWEKAARGTDGRRWPWDNEFDPAKLNSHSGSIGRTSAVGIFPGGKSPFGVYDCAGNVLEWCSSPGYSEAKYPLTLRLYEEDLMFKAGARAMRGGSWLDINQVTRAAYRDYLNPYVRSKLVGIRVAELLSDPES
jgi:formylglycine-generating enzyme required for sulfatase activity